ncbi:hypothetical protein TGDOM2_254040 [Toxoplasma gondii GAB2-2007-GAL-DOM2]|uniref:Transmembrane protein n=6 Tax=Toxoplasma gondii TaxID=5811 RepID=B9QJ26_TOXGV|nr:hypothetical protein TGVEG_254040 [Toxoplasma gondii VEG]KFG35517.1 hypothetical protein TGDOM2_254040 [Toxoplasma gondii GAB2-2007-GAL-DOM2]KFG46899.1 hypothetical protein TGP89_254040 [Toxoplasma gondii p89]KFH15006.1 hypothetical protein TGMAS_254040 [Toxoplasma gondii MAS]PUA89030.1 hypothetical protein TGBR9_254040 [Toxoplasma gondii TgCATBr9]RQX68592.1 hypothetical protein TGCAST_254040 [Toxoplasma gondii CAST]
MYICMSILALVHIHVAVKSKYMLREADLNSSSHNDKCLCITDVNLLLGKYGDFDLPLLREYGRRSFPALWSRVFFPAMIFRETETDLRASRPATARSSSRKTNVCSRKLGHQSPCSTFHAKEWHVTVTWHTRCGNTRLLLVTFIFRSAMSQSEKDRS